MKSIFECIIAVESHEMSNIAFTEEAKRCQMLPLLKRQRCHAAFTEEAKRCQMLPLLKRQRDVRCCLYWRGKDISDAAVTKEGKRCWIHCSRITRNIWSYHYKCPTSLLMSNDKRCQTWPLLERPRDVGTIAVEWQEMSDVAFTG